MRSKDREVMRIKKILKKDIRKLLKQSAKEWETYVPLEHIGGDILFGLLPKDKDKIDEALDRVNLRDEWVIISPKDIFFPQLEEMFRFHGEEISYRIEASKKLIFGIKPCDTKGLLFVNEFFRRNYEDIYYLSRAKDTLIVTVGCLNPPRPQACFCTSTNTGPFIDDGFDLQLVDGGSHYLVEIGSGRGEEFINSYSLFFKEAGKNELCRIKEIKLEAAKSVTLNIEFEKALKIVNSNNNIKGIYESIGQRCIYCGACLYVCPTCTCFNVFDDKRGDKGARMRNWDTCVLEGYTREASGHNPREEKWLRTARRYEHKLKYDYSVTGMSGCIGCGRCLSSCPVNIGMSKFIEEIVGGKSKI